MALIYAYLLSGIISFDIYNGRGEVISRFLALGGDTKDMNVLRYKGGTASWGRSDSTFEWKVLVAR